MSRLPTTTRGALRLAEWVAPIRCPRCSQMKPRLDYRPDHDAPGGPDVRRRCRSCRGGLRRYNHERALASGVCEAQGCAAPIAPHTTDTAKCAAHAEASAKFHTRRAEAHAATAYTPARERREGTRNAPTSPAPLSA